MRQEMLCTMPQRVELTASKASDFTGTVNRRGTDINLSPLIGKKSLLQGDKLNIKGSSTITYPTTYNGTTPKGWGYKINCIINGTTTKTSTINGSISYTIPRLRSMTPALNNIALSIENIPGYNLSIKDNVGNISLNKVKSVDGSPVSIQNNTLLLLNDYVYFRCTSINPGDTITIQNSSGTSYTVYGGCYTGIPLTLNGTDTSFTITGGKKSSSCKLYYGDNINVYVGFNWDTNNVPYDCPKIPNNGGTLVPDSEHQYYITYNTHTYNGKNMKPVYVFASYTYTNGGGGTGTSGIGTGDIRPSLNSFDMFSTRQAIHVGGLIPEGSITLYTRWVEEDSKIWTNYYPGINTSLSGGSSCDLEALDLNWQYNDYTTLFNSSSVTTHIQLSYNGVYCLVDIKLNETKTVTDYLTANLFKSGSKLYIRFKNTSSNTRPLRVDSLATFEWDKSYLD